MSKRTATITSKGQITLPKEIREVLKIGPGDQVDFIVSDKGDVSIVPRTCDIRLLKGLFYNKGRKRATCEDLERAIKRATNQTIS